MPDAMLAFLCGLLKTSSHAIVFKLPGVSALGASGFNDFVGYKVVRGPWIIERHCMPSFSPARRVCQNCVWHKLVLWQFIAAD